MIADDSRALLAVSYLDNCPEPLMTSRASMRASHLSDSTAFRPKPGARGSPRATGAIGSLALSELTHAY